jgi:Kef-type K+ transport system membrane component KefB
MNFNLKYVIFLYLILIVLLYLLKPNIFKFSDDENKKKKILYLIFLMIILAIISFYVKVLFEWFL